MKRRSAHSFACTDPFPVTSTVVTGTFQREGAADEISCRGGGAALLLAAGSIVVPASATPNAVTVTSGYETNVQSNQQSLGFDPSTGGFRAEAAAEAFGPAGSGGLGATRGSATAVWSGGTRATGRITSRVESRDADNYADVPFNSRQVGTAIESGADKGEKYIFRGHLSSNCLPSASPEPTSRAAAG